MTGGSAARAPDMCMSQEPIMSNNKAKQVRKLSQSFFEPFPSRSDPSEQELLASGGDFKPRTQAKYTAKLNPPQGYTVVNRPVCNGFASPSYVQLLVPLKVKEDIKEEARLDFERRTALAIQEQIEQERLHQEMTKELTVKAQASAENNQPQTEQTLPASGTEPKTVKPGFNEFMAPRELVAGSDYDPKLEYPVYAFDAPMKLFARSGLNTPDKDIRKRDDELYRKMTASTMLRDIAMPKDFAQVLDTLRLSQPHFGAVIDLIRGQLLLGERTNKTVRIPPILLDGAPGLGKTHFSLELAKALGTTVKHISFDSALTSATLIGSERRWANTQFGALFELICLGKHANPIVILDEIDKAGVRREWDPLAPLHTLLEPSTAKHVRDISVDFEFDTSMVTWIATSNRKQMLPDSLRSRFREFDIVRPNAQEAIQLASAVVAKSFENMQLADFEPPDKQFVVSLAHLTAREITQAMAEALASAVDQGRNRLTLDDLPADVRADDGDDSNETANGNGKGQTGSNN
jgi:ATP-dependent Lon protease